MTWGCDMRVLITPLMLLLPAIALASPPSMPDNADMEQARQRVELPSDAELARAREKMRAIVDMPPPASRHYVPEAPVVAGQQDAMGRMFARAEREAGAFAGKLANPPEQESLVVLVSSSMPKESLERIVRQAQKAGAAIVIRGLLPNPARDNEPDMKLTAGWVQEIAQGRDVSIQIDPETFALVGAKGVPAVALLRNRSALHQDKRDPSACADSPDYVSVAGDVSLDYALDHIATHAPAWKSAVERFQSRLKGG